MPNLYEISMLCESVYKKTLLIPHWKSIDHRIGQEELSSGETGYYGEAFLQADRKLIVVVHRGTKLYGASEKYKINSYQNRSNKVISSGNLINDAIVALKYVPPETQPALDFALHILETYPQHTIVHAGHSLGAFHANIVGYFTKKRVIGFDPVGCAEVLLKLLDEMSLQLDEKQLDQHLNLLAESNLINAVNSHLGHIYQRKGTAENNESLTSRISNTPATHKLKNFLDVLTADRINLGLEVPDVFIKIDVKLKSEKPSAAPAVIPAVVSAKPVLNHDRSLKHSASTTNLGVNIMRNSINATHILTQNNAVVSIVRLKEHDHVYLILEWMDDNQQRVTKRAELGYKVIPGVGNQAPVTDKTKAQVHLEDTSHKWLKTKSETRQFYFHTYELTIAQKARLLQKIADDQNKDLDYVKFGNEDALAGGAAGKSLDAAGSAETKNASIEANHKYASVAGVHDSIDASLRRGNSCVSWAIQTVQHVEPSCKPTGLGALFITVPEWEVAREGNAESPMCRLI